MPRPLSVVLLGYGLGGRVFHAPLIAATPALSLDAIVTRNPDRQREAQAAYPGVAVLDTAEAAWAGSYDLGVISTANVTHVPYARAALGAGMHVVLDKPIAATATDAEGLADLAAERGRLLIPYQNRRWDSDFLTAESIAASGRLGVIHRFESRIERMRVVPKTGWRESVDPEDMGGVLYDLGAHLVDQAVRFMGAVSSVAATVRTVRPPAATDDDVIVLLEHVSGGVSVLTISLCGAFAGPRLTVLGTRGGLRIQASDSQEAALVAGLRPQAGTPWGVEPAGTEAVLLEYDDQSVASETLVPLEDGRWPGFYPAVATAIVDGGPGPVQAEDVVADLRVLDAARESATRGTRVSLVPPAGHGPSSG
ncbi:MAG: Gfo/Idh/MocA family oxidoreductase [Actinomycetota bacterium]|nr:Gfo/Idh/MocA family oxidoreductase [Actinomycetota bacterium]